MKDYDVTITETLEMTVTVNAASRMEAEQLVNERWKKGDYILDADHFTGVNFKARDQNRDRGERCVLYAPVSDSPQGNGM